MKIFSERLVGILKTMQISQTEFARRLNISPNSINNYCTGRREPSMATLVLICKEVGESADYMLGIID